MTLLYDSSDNMIPPSSGSAAADRLAAHAIAADRLADYNAGGGGRTVDERLHDLKIVHSLALQQLAAKNEQVLELKDELARCHYHISGLHRREIEDTIKSGPAPEHMCD
jgi:hypothetical protein